MSQQISSPSLMPDLNLEGGRVGVLMLHGLGGTPAELRYLAQGLNRKGLAVACPLLKGHGGSDLLLNTATWPDWVASGRAAFAQLAERCDRVVICGQSAGAMIAIHLASELCGREKTGQAAASKLAGLVLCSPTFWPDGWAIPRTLQAFRIVQQRWLADLFCFHERAPYGIKDERLRKFVLDSLQQDGRPLDDIFGRRGGTVYEFRKLADKARRKLKHISVPSLVFHARDDDQAALGNALRVVRGVKGRVDLVVLDDSYHLVSLDRQRGVVLSETARFVERVAGVVSADQIAQGVSAGGGAAATATATVVNQ